MFGGLKGWKSFVHLFDTKAKRIARDKKKAERESYYREIRALAYPSNENVKLGSRLDFLCKNVPCAILIAPTSDAKVLDYMQRNYDETYSIVMEKVEVPFYYLPLSLKKGSLRNALLYNNPALELSEAQILGVIDKFDSIIRKRNNLDSNGYGIALMDFNDPTAIIDFYTINPDKDIVLQIDEWMSYLYSNVYLTGIDMHQPDIAEGKVVKKGADILIEVPHWTRACFSKDIRPRPADDDFNEEGGRLGYEIVNRINQLKERGFMKILAQIMEEMQEALAEVSRLHITRDYRIYLSDWGNKEVVMAPLPKTVFILFLNHPEGILFKELIDHKEEIRDIYKNITLRENIDEIEESIEALVDPMNNSINEKCSRIRAAFLDVVPPHLATFYHISGKRAEPKKITLDRSLLVIEKLIND